MNHRLLAKFAAVFAVGAFALATGASANTVTVNGILTATSPTYNRPLTTTSLSGVGTSVYYQLQPFYVTAATPFTLETTAANLTPTPADDTFLALYQNAFNPASPLTNLVAIDDDSGAGALSLITLTSGTLIPGRQYFAVTSPYYNATTGTYTEAFAASAATVVLGVVPEPSTYALLGAGLLGGAMLARRRQTVAA